VITALAVSAATCVTCCISSASLFNVPFGGWCMRLAGDVPVYFTKEKGGMVIAWSDAQSRLLCCMCEHI